MFEDTHWLQVKIDEYLQGTPELPQHIIFQASQNFNEKLTRFNSKPRGKSALPSLSQIGKPFSIKLLRNNREMKLFIQPEALPGIS